MKTVILCILLSFVISMLHFGSLGTIKPLGDVLFGEGNKEVLGKLEKYGDWGKTSAQFLRDNVFNNPYRALYALMGVALAMTVIKNLLRFLQEYLAGYVTHKAIIDVSNELFQHVQNLPAKYFNKEGSAEISARFVNDIPLMSRGIKDVFGKAIREPLKAIGTFLLALMIHWQLTLLSCFILPLVVLFLRKLGKKLKKGAKKALSEQAKIMGILEQAFRGNRIVKAYQMENCLQKKFEKENNNLLRYQMKVVAADVAANPVMETFVVAAGVVILSLSAHLVFSHQMSTGDFCAFYGALAALFDPLRKLSDLNNNINTSVAAGERVFELMDMVPEIRNSPQAIVLAPMKENIVWDHVCFSYDPGKPVLKDVSFSIRRGEHVAVVGRSGAGKSTLVSLLLRLYDADSGAIRIDGHDIRDVTLESLRAQIGLVTQESFLFNDTITANIICSTAFDQLSQAGVIPANVLQSMEKAAKASYSDIFIEDLSQKYQTLYGPGGIELSGGQKHRISMARAIFKEPAILILDEAMANLDSESESYILQALEKFTQNRTSFIIAHRFSTIEKVDRILVLDEGKLEGFGTHQELLQKSSIYRSLYEKQTLK